ncbi:HNH endonuclease [Tenacibaculum sp. nBUS_03]|uniref:HNH endonuclease n=1 Tax=Tenacibaculum sp. nBUS_03 TaxID=3395320 RepID=UPI003EC00BA3
MTRLLIEREAWIINRKYVLSQEDLDILQEYPVKVAKDWSKKEYKPIRDRIRAHYFSIQNKTCSYCRLPINEGTDNVEIEHIIDKNRRLDFIFETLNLVVSCHKCNFSKSKKEVMNVCPPENTYPIDGTTFNIIHGHYDNYFDHIEFLANSSYHALTNKGAFTIDKCKLDRVGLAEQRERISMYENDSIISDVLEIKNSVNPNEKIEALIEKLKQIRQ